MAQIEPVLDAKGAADQVEDVDQAPVPLLVLNIWLFLYRIRTEF